MEWYLSLLFYLGILVALLLVGLPVAFCFLLVDVMAAFLLWGGLQGFEQLILALRGAVTTWMIIPIPMFILMGEIMLHAGMGQRLLNVLDMWLGRLPGRLSLIAIGGGTLFAFLSGSSVASVAMLGTTLVPEIEKRGYKRTMGLGPILASGALAAMIPPSAMAILLASVSDLSVAKFLMAIIIPGLVMAALFASYIFIRCQLTPEIAPAYDATLPPISARLAETAKAVPPVAIIIFLVIFTIILGIATPSEAAAGGAFGCLLAAALNKKLNWKLITKSITGTMEITAMMLLIVMGAVVFGRILAFSGATSGLVEFSLQLPVPTIVIIIGMQVILLIAGCFMDVVSMMMILAPLFFPVVSSLGFDPIWFGVIFLLNAEVGFISPPFGMSLFVMKGVAPKDTTIGEVYRAALPFLGICLVVMALIIVFPSLVLWLPSAMK